MTRRSVRPVVACAAALLVAACGGGERGAAPTAPTATNPTITVAGAPPPGGGVATPTRTSGAPVTISYPDLPPEILPISGPRVAFPPRNEPFAFRLQLETVYRDQLQRPATSTFVDIEGTIVWTQEYLRYRLSGCGHADGVQKVMSQIDGRGIAPDCGGDTTTFPPRNEPFDFRANALEAKYRDGLRRTATQSFVDIEGDIVWTQEYIRYRVLGCNHELATSLVFGQIAGVAPPLTSCTEPPPTTQPPGPTIPPPSGLLQPGIPTSVVSEVRSFLLPNGPFRLLLELVGGTGSATYSVSAITPLQGTLSATTPTADRAVTGPGTLVVDSSRGGTVRVTLVAP